jgi:hypothetical protein
LIFEDWPKKSSSIVNDEEEKKRIKNSKNTNLRNKLLKKDLPLAEISTVFGVRPASPKENFGPTIVTTSTDDEEMEDTGHYGCIRKLVARGFPYDYSVDRKCVWKFCLFEQVLIVS